MEGIPPREYDVPVIYLYFIQPPDLVLGCDIGLKSHNWPLNGHLIFNWELIFLPRTVGYFQSSQLLDCIHLPLQNQQQCVPRWRMAWRSVRTQMVQMAQTAWVTAVWYAIERLMTSRLTFLDHDGYTSIHTKQNPHPQTRNPYQPVGDFLRYLNSLSTWLRTYTLG